MAESIEGLKPTISNRQWFYKEVTVSFNTKTLVYNASIFYDKIIIVSEGDSEDSAKKSLWDYLFNSKSFIRA